MYKQVIILRSDVKMGKGKMISQCLHAAIGALKKTDKKLAEEWGEEGSKKVVLKSTLKEMRAVEKELKKVKMPYFLVRDAGLTQLKKGTITALGIGPTGGKGVDKITGKLKLL